MAISFRQLNELWGLPSNDSSLLLDQVLGPISIDSRNFDSGSFFVPLKGEYFDGHDFLLQVFERGAQGAVVSCHTKNIPDGLLHWVVEDTLYAYQQLANLHRLDVGTPVVAITGSTGKTTTRELIRAALSTTGEVLASEGNNNNDIGVPLTLLQSSPCHFAAVIEMGMRARGEIERLSYCTQPDIAVITNIGSAHLGLLGSRQAIAAAKCEITSFLRPDGLLLIPAGNDLLEQELSKTWTGRVKRVSLELGQSQDDIYNKDLCSETCPLPDLIGQVDSGSRTLKLNGLQYKLPLEGRHNALNFMFAIAVAMEFGINQSLLKNLEVIVPGGRSRKVNIGGLTVLDETYNASPEAMYASLTLLMSQPGRHFAVLGTMYELGKYSASLHQSVAQFAVDLGLDGLVVLATGVEADVMESVASSLRYFAVVSSPEKAIDVLEHWLKPGDVILLKASRNVGMESLLPLIKELFG